MMISFRYCLACVILGFVAATADGQEDEAPLPKIWNDILREAEVVLKEAGDSFRRDMLWEPAKRIAQRYDRSAIETLWRSEEQAYKHLRSKNSVKVYKNSKMLSAFVIIELADPEDSCGLMSTYKEPIQGIWSSTRGLILAAIDCYHDEASREFLLNIALDDQMLPELGKRRRGPYDMPSLPGLALQFLRGYESTQELRDKLEKALHTEEAAIEKYMHSNWDSMFFTHADDLRAVLSSIDYAASLKDPAEQARYRGFQSRLWRARATGPRGFRGVQMQFSAAAGIVSKQWQEGDERFVLRIFEDPASLPDETRIAIYLAHILPDTKKLEAIASSTSPQAESARRALVWNAQSKIKKPIHVLPPRKVHKKGKADRSNI